MKWRVVTGHEMDTLSIQAEGFNNYLISQVFANFVNIRWYFFHRWLNKYTIHWQFMTIYEKLSNFKTSLGKPHPSPLPSRIIVAHCIRKSISDSLLNFAITKTCVAIRLAEAGTRMSGV